MGKCGMCDLTRIYKQFEKKKNVQNTTKKDVSNAKTVDDEPVVIAVQEIKRVVKTKKKKVESAEITDEGNNIEE